MVNGNPKTTSWLVVIPKPPLDIFDSFMVNLKPLVFGQLETMQLSRSLTTSTRFLCQRDFQPLVVELFEFYSLNLLDTFDCQVGSFSGNTELKIKRGC